MKTACYNVPVSRNGAEPAPRWLSHYIITVRVAYFVMYTFDWPQFYTSMHLAQAHGSCKSLCACNFLSCLTFCWSASSFDKQVDSVKEHLTRTCCHCLFVAWLHLKYCCDSDSTKAATIQQGSHVVGQNAAPHCRIPRKGSELSFFWISHCQLCELWRPEFGSLRCLLERASQRWNPELHSRSYNRNTCPRPARSSTSPCWMRSPEKKE